MAIGMTYDQYWYGDVRMTRAFIEADKIKQERKNAEMWLQGMYIYDAISRLAPILNGFSKNPKALEYPRNPYPTKETKKKQSEKQVENEKLKAQLFFKQWASATSKHFRNGGG